jgi:cysteinyl-tRNA synthetase
MEELARSEEDKAFKDEINGAQLHYLEALDDDFNTAGAIAVLYELCNTINRYIDQQRLETHANKEKMTLALEGARMLTTLGQILGLLNEPIEKDSGGDALAGQLMELLIEMRAEARKEKNFALADAIRNKLKNLDIVLEDRPDGSTDWHKE